MTKVSFIGIGRLGLASALCFSKAGYDVLGMDVNEKYVQSLKDRTFKTHEPQVEDMLKETKMQFTTDLITTLQHSDYIFVLVPTPNGPKAYDHSILSDVLLKIGETGIVNKYIIIGCTVMPGYINQIARELIGDNRLIYNPEFIAQGTIVRDFMNPDIVLIGADNRDISEKVAELYKSFVPSTSRFCLMSVIEAEVCKISLNGFITMKIAYANLIGDLVVSHGGKADPVLEAIGSDSRVGGKCFRHGDSFGGPCFPRDVKALARLIKKQGLPNDLIVSISKSNKEHYKHQAKKYTNDDPDTISYVAYKDTQVPIIEGSGRLKIAKVLAQRGKPITIRDRKVVINEVRKKYGKMFKYVTI